MFPIPLMTSGTGFHAEASSSQSNCPPPPYVVHKAVEFSLQESACSIRAVKEALEAGRLEDAVVYLESLQAKLVPLGKVADAQIRAHGRKPRGQAAETPIIDVVATRAFPESSVPPIPVPTSTVDPALVAETRRVMRHLTSALASSLASGLEDGLQSAPPSSSSAFDSQVCRPRRPRIAWSPEDDELLTKGLQEFGTAYKKIAAKYFPHRTGDQLRVRHKTLGRHLQRAAEEVAADTPASDTTVADVLRNPGSSPGNSGADPKCRQQSVDV